ncbi:hypothetical protein J2S09_001106 [Bacillus fengqiuensis]|nr:hypothetical protein [Bacillus fengqiuensis]
MRLLSGREIVSEATNIMLAIGWIWFFLQNKRECTVNLIHIMLLVGALVILPISLYKVFNTWLF